MENPMLIGNHKFDIRQWVRVADWNPLTIWFYDAFYCRFAVEEYDVSDLKDTLSHLVNNSISKGSKHYHRSFFAENGQEVKDHMWDMISFEAYIGSERLSFPGLAEGMKGAVPKSLSSARDSVEHRKGS